MKATNPSPQNPSHAQIWPANDMAAQEAARFLAGGGIVALPTETVYGLAANAADEQAVARIYTAKGRPDFNPLIVHVASIQAAQKLADFSDDARRLADAFWPGPLTLVLPRKADAPLAAAVTAGLPSLAIRCPAHPLMQQILRISGLNLAAPSANKSGAISPTQAAHVAASLGDKVPLILDGGPCAKGLESTIIALDKAGGWRLLRPGPIGREAIAALIGPQSSAVAAGKIEAPGQLASHYAPAKPLRLNADTPLPGEWFISFGAADGDDNLSPSGDLAEAASRLYACLHRADASNKSAIAIARIQGGDIADAINDRLKRAATR